MNRKKVAEVIFITGLLLVAAALPLSVFMMSIGQFMLLAGWLLDGKIPGKIKSAFSNPVVAALAGVYFMHMIGGIYSTDSAYFFHDMRIKLPLLALPVLIFSGPAISEKWFSRLIWVFILAVTASSLISMGILYDLLPHKNPVNNARDISVFISHIRLSLFVCLAAFGVAYFLFKNYRKNSALMNVCCLMLTVWFLYFLVILEAMTGFAILVIALLCLLLYYAMKIKSLLFKAGTLMLIVIIPLSLILYIKNEATKIYRKQSIDFSRLESSTANGNPYSHCSDCFDQENGNLVWIYVCEPELNSAWNKRSTLFYSGKDRMNHDLKYTLIRFLASKGLRKDSSGVFSLSESEIRSVENGIANAEYQDVGNLRIRLHKTIMEYYSYKSGKNPSGNSMMQRIEYWKTGWIIFKKNFWTGVGTGDVKIAFEREYVLSDSTLSAEWRKRAHNQYLTIALTFGIFGLVYFLFSLFFPLFRKSKQPDFLYLAFLFIAALSMFTEDTLETQAGVTFYAFFNALLLSGQKNSPYREQ